MLYDLHELQRSFLAPLAAFTGTSSQWFSNPYSPLAYTPLSRQLAAASELVHRIGKDYEKPAWGLNETQIDGQTVAVREVEHLSKPFCKLIHFERDHPKAAQDPTILLVAPLSGHHATLLRETVRALLPDHSVYVTDWIDARMVPRSAGPFHLDDYVLYVQEFIQALGSKVHVMSVCQPTVPVLAAVSLMATRRSAVMPRSMIMMGGPIDTRQSPTEVNRLATTKSYSWFENNLIHRVPTKYPGAHRRVYPGFLQHAGFVAMNPDRHVSSHYDFYQHLIKGDDDDAQAHRRFYDEYNAVLDMPAEFYLDTIRIVFQEHRLPKGQWHVHGEQVRPQDIDGVALFTIEGELDDISGQGQTHSAQALCAKIAPELKQQFTAPNCGHYGIFSGSRWRTLICPKIRDFIRQHN
ncbi:polyhydroxyalkanoate depolymerase [Alcaligenes sp. A-TC2]|uniref:polyhydroxyalkanoate depolymerase n=1 Tax=Alcaligenes TaxID=507 RepID=UPI0009F6158F|nr:MULTISPECIES: polyhydroxyalkanoate depolymerase [Alcaligenes]MCB4322904.1 polyhydroxyalkanoate depolymerase [Alcaligenes sp. 13f]MCX5470890.1 polyhydroxyalkanoate depolymerase [Alcaligenes nematophilus]OQV32788.1 polyhydroxyalkanoate depolymerase [Alcaligenes phenolicus]USY24355.1 polyhydroxyalkanoate depolymerase [Alcaligenes sp. 1735tsa3]